MNVLEGLPFLGLLLSIAILPGLAPRFWLRRMGWVALGWSVVLLALVVVDSTGWVKGASAGWHLAWHALLIDYLPFVTMLGGLYTAAGGIQVRGGPPGTPAGNTLTLAIGMLLGLAMGPTGAAMVLIQPLLAANAHRQHKRHLVLFLIVLVANISGALTPLGNPPLFAGMLRGVPFLWPARALLLPYLVLTAMLLCAFYLIDRWFAARDRPAQPEITQQGRRNHRAAKVHHPQPTGLPQVRGWLNLLLIILLGLSVMQQGLALPEITLLGETVGTGRLAGSAVAVAIGVLSWVTTSRSIRRATNFTWHPMSEVAVLFAGIFVTLEPVSKMLQAGPDGPMAGLLQLTQGADGQPEPLVYFWMTGMLSAFLDNAPTYLVFFDLAGIKPQSPGHILVAISAGAVFFGGLTYIGNAPNLMLRAIAAHRGVGMPGFAGYLAVAAALLLPAFMVLSIAFFWR